MLIYARRGIGKIKFLSEDAVPNMPPKRPRKASDAEGDSRMLFIKRLSRNDLESLLHASSIPIEAITQKLPAAMKTVTQQLAVPTAKALREGDTGLFDMLSPELQVCDTAHINRHSNELYVCY